ncbi:MAG TPA: hypothetical protein VF786_08685, partial [Terriglobales bacterium]
RFQTPAVAVLAGSAWSIVLAATGTFEQLLTYVVFSGWIFYGLGAACVFIYRRRRQCVTRPYSVPGYPVVPIVFIAAAVAIVVNTILAEPRRAAFGVFIILMGIPAFAAWSWRKRRGTRNNVTCGSALHTPDLAQVSEDTSRAYIVQAQSYKDQQ